MASYVEELGEEDWMVVLLDEMMVMVGDDVDGMG